MKKIIVVVVALLLVSMVTYGSGWVDKGSYVRLDSISDQVIIGSPYKPGGNQTGVAKVYIVNGSQYLELAKGFLNTARLRFRAEDTNGGSIAYTWNAPLKFYNGNMIERMRIAGNGNVGIGTTSPDYKLDVNGTIRAKEIKVETGWSDFVFSNDYKLMPLDKLEKHIKANKSLPGIPTEKEVVENGVNLGEMQAKFLEKIEELTLYVIELKKENEELKSRISALEK